jgi:hypothetical protein
MPPLFLVQLGSPGSRAALAMFAASIVAVRLLGPQLPDRIGHVRCAAIALVLVGAGLGATSFATSLGIVLAATAVIGIGHGSPTRRSSPPSLSGAARTNGQRRWNLHRNDDRRDGRMVDRPRRHRLHARLTRRAHQTSCRRDPLVASRAIVRRRRSHRTVPSLGGRWSVVARRYRWGASAFG